MTFFSSWQSWVSGRFLTGRQGGRGRVMFVFSVVLIGMGVATLNTVLAVMNGLQQGYIRSILEIGSYHLRWSPETGLAYESTELHDVANTISDNEEVLLVVEFREGQTMLTGVHSRPLGSLIRGVPPSLYDDDLVLAKLMNIADGDFDLAGNGIVIGLELARRLGVIPGSRLFALNLGEPGMSPGEVELEVRGVFECAYRDYQASMAFVSLETAEELFGYAIPELGIKLRRPERDRAVMSSLKSALGEHGEALSSWRDNNRSFFGALRTEKIMMFLLLTLIFVVVAVNIDHSLRRMATERIEDISIIKAMGASPRHVRSIFLRQGLIIGGFGGIIGSVLGVAIGGNVDSIISTAEQIAYFFSAYSALGVDAPPTLGAFLKNSEVMVQDVLTILSIAVLISLLAAIRAASQAASRKPAEVLRSE